MDITTEFSNEGIKQADQIIEKIDQLDQFMTQLENAGIIFGWKKFATKQEGNDEQEICS